MFWRKKSKKQTPDYSKIMRLEAELGLSPSDNETPEPEPCRYDEHTYAMYETMTGTRWLACRRCGARSGEWER